MRCGLPLETVEKSLFKLIREGGFGDYELEDFYEAQMEDKTASCDQKDTL